MKTTIDKYDFERAFVAIRPDNFSRAGLDALFAELTMLENDQGEELELDVIAICCDWTEYANLKEFQEAYDDTYETIEQISDEHWLIPIDNFADDSFIVQNF